MRKTGSLRERLGNDELDLSSGVHKYVDGMTRRSKVRIGPGSYFVSYGEGEILTTVLGSCISVCAGDPETGVGGMNHFMLPMPTVSDGPPNTVDLRTGAHAMEALLNDILRHGCPRSRIKLKIFGGADMIGTAHPVGATNIEFALDYFKREGMPIEATDIGGTDARKLEYEPRSGRARVKLIVDHSAQKLRSEEERYQKQLSNVVVTNDVELF